MKIEFTGRHYHVGDRARQFTEKKLAKLKKFHISQKKPQISADIAIR